MSAPYQSELLHALNPLYANGMPIRSANERQLESIDVIEEDDDTGDEVHDSDVTEVVADAQLTEGDISPPAAHSCVEEAPCQWIDGGALETCGAGISCTSVSAHFRDIHGVKRIWESTMIPCLWKGCGKSIQRKGFVRHVRECHLGHRR